MQLFSFICRAESISLENAVSIANKFLSVNMASWQIDLKKNSSLLRVPSRNSLSPTYYIFKGNDNRGFIVVSADDVAQPVLGYSFDSKISDNGEIPSGMQEWLDDMEQQIRGAKENEFDIVANQKQKLSDLTIGNSCVKLETAEWEQGSPFNDKCPMIEGNRCLSGCVPTAYAILMKYYGYPISGRGVTPSYKGEENGVYVYSRNLNHSYNWSSMPLIYEGGNYSNTASNQVSTLLADIGAALQVDYGIDATSGRMGKISLYTYFDYNPGTEEHKDSYSSVIWHSKLRKELDQGHPIVYKATEEEGGGHAFILDGYTDKNYFSVNWGWGGRYNGFFTLNALQPGYSDFKSNQSAFFNCVPMPLCNNDEAVEMNGIKYSSLKLAIAAAPTNRIGNIIKLTSDITSDYIEIEEGKNIILDLNGKELCLNNTIENYGSLCIYGQNGGRIEKTHGNGAILLNYRDLTIFSGIFNNLVMPSSSSNYCRCIWTAEGSTTLIQEGTFSSSGQVVLFNGEATIVDGDFTNTGNQPVVCCAGPVHIYGGTYKSQNNVIMIYDNNNDLTISGGRFTTSGNTELICNYNNSGKLIINGGIFSNTAPSPTNKDYRRAVWTASETNTLIEGGIFKSPYQVLCFNGYAILKDGVFINTENDVVVGCAGSVQIFGGNYESLGRVIYIFDNNHDLTISGGTFMSFGNSSVVVNYNTNGKLIISGGSFTNSAPSPSESDYRRAVWTAAETTTIIDDGLFNAPMQTLCFNGNATINNGTINNTSSGYGVLAHSNSLVSIKECKLKALKPFYAGDGSTIACEGGLFSEMIDMKFIKDEYKCCENTDYDTCVDYPYVIVRMDEDGVTNLFSKSLEYSPTYNLNGQRVNNNSSGVLIQNGRKQLKR